MSFQNNTCMRFSPGIRITVTSCVQGGSSCLLVACHAGHLDMVKYLCERGGEKLLMLMSKVSVCSHM
jgi:hypothetical protein